MTIPHRRNPGEREVTITELEGALIVAARLVDLHGEQCLPIFERLEEELIVMHLRERVVDRARQIVATGDLSAYEEAASAAPIVVRATSDDALRR